MSDSAIHPPIQLRSGHKIHGHAADTPLYLIGEVFKRQCYTGPAFYTPEPGHVVVDCGAHIGVFALFLASSAPGIRVHCFEPSASIRARLMRNVQENVLGSSIDVHPFAVGHSNGARVLNVGEKTGHTSFYDVGSEPVATEVAECLTLTEAVARCGAEQVDLLKIDTEGSECEILESGDPETWSRIKRIAMEFHDNIIPGARERVLSILETLAFDIVRIDTAPPFNEQIGIIQAVKRSLLVRRSPSSAG